MLGQIQVRKEIAARLKKARIAAGYTTPQAFCEEKELPIEEYSAHEEGDLPIVASVALKYCGLLDISLHWLMLGENLSKAHSKEKV